MIEIISPPLSHYHDTVRLFAARYIGDADEWYKLNEQVITDGDDRDYFTFIRMALWDKLMEEEFRSWMSPPEQVDLFGECDTTEPGGNPGSFILDGHCWALINTRRSLVGFSTLANI